MKISGKFLNIWTLNSVLLNHVWITELFISKTDNTKQICKTNLWKSVEYSKSND